MKRVSLTARAIAAGLWPSTVHQRKRSGWLECDLLTPPLPRNHCVNKRRPARSHPWRRENAADTITAQLSALNLRKKAKLERAS